MTICGGPEVDTPPRVPGQLRNSPGCRSRLRYAPCMSSRPRLHRRMVRAGSSWVFHPRPPEWSCDRTELWRSGGTSSVQASRQSRGAPIRADGVALSGVCVRPGALNSLPLQRARGSCRRAGFLAKRSGRPSRRTRLDRTHRSLSVRRQCQLLGGGPFGRVPDAGAWHDNDLA
jgi:hypothetical protein